MKPTKTQLIRRATAKKWRKDVIKNGGRTLQVMLQPDAAQALDKIIERTSETVVTTVSRLLIDDAKKIKNSA